MEAAGKYQNIKKMKYTLSISNALSGKNLSIISNPVFIERLKQFKHKIHDLNFTCRVTPFETDAMGVAINSIESEIHLNQLLELQDETGIKISAVFNNIYVPNNIETLEVFVKHLEPLYLKGLRSITIPHILWMHFGLLQREFPEMTIKNTVLRHVRTGQEFWNNALAGFDYVNIDRVVLRDENMLKEIADSQKLFYKETGKYVYTSLLTQEGCKGNCSLLEEHYQHTMMHPNINGIKNDHIFMIPTKFECNRVKNDLTRPLQEVGFNGIKEDIDILCKYFDIVKFGGRRQFYSLKNVLENIEKLEDDNVATLFEGNKTHILAQLERSKPEALDKWRKTIRNCRYQCWKCPVCSSIISSIF